MGASCGARRGVQEDRKRKKMNKRSPALNEVRERKRLVKQYLNIFGFSYRFCLSFYSRSNRITKALRGNDFKVTDFLFVGNMGEEVSKMSFLRTVFCGSYLGKGN